METRVAANAAAAARIVRLDEFAAATWTVRGRRVVARLRYVHFGEVRAASEVAPYNEVLAPVKRAAVVAIFARTRQARHLLLALGARDLLAGLGGPRLPIFVLDAGGGAAPAVFTPAAQAGLLRRVAARPAPDLRVGKTAPRLTTASLRGADGLAVHGAYGLTDEALRDALLDDAAPGKAAARALGAALSSGNAVAAKAVARRVGADLGLLATDAGASVSLPPRPDHLDEECLRAWGAVAALVAVASGALAARCRDVVELLGRRVGNTGAFEMFFARTLRAATRGGGATRAPERTSRRDVPDPISRAGWTRGSSRRRRASRLDWRRIETRRRRR